MARLRLFASAREAAGTGHDDVPGATVREALEVACGRYGHDFAGLLEICQVWCNGEPAAADAPVGDDDEIAVLPPVSGGSAAVRTDRRRASADRSEPVVSLRCHSRSCSLRSRATRAARATASPVWAASLPPIRSAPKAERRPGGSGPPPRGGSRA